MARVYLTMWLYKYLLLVFISQMLGIFLVKFLNTSCCIDKFLLPGKKRMAGGTDFDTDLLADRSQLKLTATCAFCFNFIVFGMNFRFHVHQPPKIYFLTDYSNRNNKNL